MNKLVSISVFSLAFVAGCEQRSTADERSGSDPMVAPTEAEPTRTSPGNALPTDALPSPAVPSSATPGRGEGERELPMGAASAAEAPGDSVVGDRASGDSPTAASPASDSVLAEDYRKEISSDPDLAATASDTRLAAHGGQLLLMGTVATDDLKESLGELAKVLADGREVKNEITIAEQ